MLYNQIYSEIVKLKTIEQNKKQYKNFKEVIDNSFGTLARLINNSNQIDKISDMLEFDLRKVDEQFCEALQSCLDCKTKLISLNLPSDPIKTLYLSYEIGVRTKNSSYARGGYRYGGGWFYEGNMAFHIRGETSGLCRDTNVHVDDIIKMTKDGPCLLGKTLAISNILNHARANPIAYADVYKLAEDYVKLVRNMIQEYRIFYGSTSNNFFNKCIEGYYKPKDWKSMTELLKDLKAKTDTEIIKDFDDYVSCLKYCKVSMLPLEAEKVRLIKAGEYIAHRRTLVAKINTANKKP